jgi:hypothetical protein
MAVASLEATPTHANEMKGSPNAAFKDLAAKEELNLEIGSGNDFALLTPAPMVDTCMLCQ